MAYRDDIDDGYFNWLYNIVCHDRFSNGISYRKLLSYLYYTNFRYTIKRDENRACDGVDLRLRYYDYVHNSGGDVFWIERYLDGRPCNVLETMVALAIRCEEDIMDDPRIGDRTSQWFWEMIVNLGVGSMTDDRFDERYVEEVIETFLNRKYEPDGRGGLFTVRNCDTDLRKVEIWYQLCWYLNSIT